MSDYRRVIPDFRHDLHYAARVIRRNPGYAIAATLCLALGIGVNSTVFSLLDGMYLRMLPVPHPDRVVAIDRDGGMPLFWRDYRSLRGDLRAFSGVAALQSRGTFMDVERANFVIVAETVSVNYADVLQIKPALGRWFLASDESPGAEPSVVISGHVWTAHFRRDPSVIGRSVRIENQWYRVIGVAPDDFRGVSPPMEIDAWLPLVTFPIFQPQLRAALSPGPPVALVARLALHQTVERAAAEMRVLDVHLRQAYPRVQQLWNPYDGSGISWHRVSRIASLHASHRNPVTRGRGDRASDCVRQRGESSSLPGGSPAARNGTAALARSLAKPIGPSGSRREHPPGAGRCCAGNPVRLLDRPGSLLLGSGLHPAVGDPGNLPGNELAGGRIHGSRGAGLRSTVQPGARSGGLLSRPAVCPQNRRPLRPKTPSAAARRLRGRPGSAFPGPPDRRRRCCCAPSSARRRSIRGSPPITASTSASSLRSPTSLRTAPPGCSLASSTRRGPCQASETRRYPSMCSASWTANVSPWIAASPATHASINVVEPNYFEMMHVPLLRGRNFAAYDLPKSPRVIIVNETMAKRWWPGQDAVGKVAWLGCENEEPRAPAQVIAVARDSKYGALDEDPRPFFYVSRHQVWWNGFFALILADHGRSPRR